MKCLVCGREMEEYSSDLHGVSEFSLSPTTYAGSVFACPLHGTTEMQEERANSMMWTVVTRDSLSGDDGPQVVEHFNTLEEAVDFAAGMLEEVALECVDERAQLRPMFRKLAKLLRRASGIVKHAGLDGYEVRIMEKDQEIDEFCKYGQCLRYDAIKMLRKAAAERGEDWSGWYTANFAS